MVRIPLLPADLSEPRDLVDTIRARRGGPLVQVDRLLLHSPRLAAGWNSWIGAVRAPTKLSYRHKELATCAVAILNDTEFEVVRHAPVFIREGGVPAQLDAMQQDIESAMQNPALFDVTERAILKLAFEITRHIKVRDDVFHRAREAVGSDEAILELIAVITTYNMTTRFVMAFGVEIYGDAMPGAAKTDR